MQYTKCLLGILLSVGLLTAGISCAQAKQAGQVACQLSCMSRAGREPGYKKQNQDNCFAFEKYVAAGQSLFGAFDGHGPNGAASLLAL